jgi:hypothetical protein
MEVALELRASELLPALKREAIERGRRETEIDRDRSNHRAKGRSAHEIAACEFAEMRLFDDLGVELGDRSAASAARAARRGKPSATTLAIAERDGHCIDCVLYWYALFAKGLRDSARQRA